MQDLNPSVERVQMRVMGGIGDLDELGSLAPAHELCLVFLAKNATAGVDDKHRGRDALPFLSSWDGNRVEGLDHHFWIEPRVEAVV